MTGQAGTQWPDVVAALAHLEELPVGPERDRFGGWLLAALVERLQELEVAATAARQLIDGLADESTPLTELGDVMARLQAALGMRSR